MKLVAACLLFVACSSGAVRANNSVTGRLLTARRSSRDSGLSVRGGAASKPSVRNVQVKKPSVGQKKASVATSIFNLSNNVAGAGILTLAAGKASGVGWVPSVLICTALAFVSAHTFTLIGKSCELTGEESFKGLWAKAFGPKTAYVVDSMVFVQCFLVSIIYTGLLGDIFSALLQTSGINIPAAWTSRKSIILLAAPLVLLPLNLIRDLSSLGFTSILGLFAVLYTVFFILVRSLDGTYALGDNLMNKVAGKFVSDGAIIPPSFEKSTWWNVDFNALVLMSNLGLAFISHYNGPSYWKSLANATAERFGRVAMSSYAILAVIYVTTMVSGYATFGDTCKGNILMNYHPADVLSTLGRLATGFSILFGFPLISNGAREGLKNASSALGINTISDPNNHSILVVGLLICTTSLAIALSDIKLVAGLTGACMGSALVYICPPLIYSAIVKKIHGEQSLEYANARKNVILVPFGLFVAGMGIAMTLKNNL